MKLCIVLYKNLFIVYHWFKRLLYILRKLSLIFSSKHVSLHIQFSRAQVNPTVQKVCCDMWWHKTADKFKAHCLKTVLLRGMWYQIITAAIIPQTRRPGCCPAAAEGHWFWSVRGWQESCTPARTQSSWDPEQTQKSPGTSSCSSLYCGEKKEQSGL